MFERHIGLIVIIKVLIFLSVHCASVPADLSLSEGEVTTKVSIKTRIYKEGDALTTLN
jgi:hypothetical protein